MAKRGRKPSTEKKTGYFEEREEKAFVRYIKEQDKHEKEKIFNTFLMEPFTKMTESIIRRYNLYVPDEDFNETFNDAMSFLMTKINNFNPDTSFKAYSYTGTIIKNYLMGKINAYVKKQKRNSSYDNENIEINDSIKFSSSIDSDIISFLTELIKDVNEKISTMVNNPKEYNLNEDEIIVGKVLMDLLENWDIIFNGFGSVNSHKRFSSEKFNKSAVLFYLKENTNMDTKTIRNSMKKYKEVYYIIKKNLLK